MSEKPIQKILIIDDSDDYRKLLIKFFKKAFPDAETVEFDPADTSADAITWSAYDLLILDYDLGNGGNGLEWLRKYKTTADFPPTIMLTAQDDEELVVNAIRYGAQSFLRKTGLTRTLLLESVENALKKYKAEKTRASSEKIQVHSFNKEKFFDSLKSIKKNDAILLVELNNFQGLQEILGIFSIDSFINFFSETLSACLKDSPYTAQLTRISDSTMAVILNKTGDPGKLDEFISSICSRFDSSKYKSEDGQIDYSVNIGAVIVDTDKADINKTLSSVERACRKARQEKGNSYVMEGDNEIVSENEQSLVDEIMSAIKENQVVPLYQSLVLVSGTSHRDFDDIYQIRVNITDSGGNAYPPKKFIPVLEKTNSMKKLDRWIIHHCLSKLSGMVNDSNRPGILIPISAESINDKGLTDWINKVIEQLKNPSLGKTLIFEILASDFVEMSAQAKLQFNKLRIKLKSYIALSNVNDMETLNKCVNHGKFDFVLFSPEHTGTEKMKIEQIQAIVNTARQHKSMTVASRIDSGEYLALAASAGVDYVLGHFVQPPMEKIISTEEVEVA